MCLIPGASEKGQQKLDGLQSKVVKMIEGLEKKTLAERLKGGGAGTTLKLCH